MKIMMARRSCILPYQNRQKTFMRKYKSKAKTLKIEIDEIMHAATKFSKQELRIEKFNGKIEQ